MTSSQLQNLCESLARHHTGPMAGQTRYCYQCQMFFFQLRQLRRVRRSLNYASVATLVHAFVTSRVDYCNCLLAGATKASLDKLQRVMNAAARVVSDTHKFDRGLTSIFAVTTYIGWTSLSVSRSDFVSRSTSVGTTWHQ